jgi:hypothetical protein
MSHGDRVYGNFACHDHFDWEETRSAARHEVIVTDAI